jgi:hypothetical protein
MKALLFELIGLVVSMLAAAVIGWTPWASAKPEMMALAALFTAFAAVFLGAAFIAQDATHG